MSAPRQRFGVFGYGSNNLIQLYARVHDTEIPSSRAVLPGYERIFVGSSPKWGGSIATLREKPGAYCRGTLAWLTEEEIRLLDPHEGCNSDSPGDTSSVSRYRRVRVPLLVWGTPSEEVERQISKGSAGGAPGPAQATPSTQTGTSAVVKVKRIRPSKSAWEKAVQRGSRLTGSPRAEDLLAKQKLGRERMVFDQYGPQGREEDASAAVCEAWVYMYNVGSTEGAPSAAYVAAIVKNLELYWKAETEDELKGLEGRAAVWDDGCIRNKL